MKPAQARGNIRVMCADQVCVDKLYVARGPWLRFRGLMNRSEIPAAFGQGLLFPHCRSLHTCWMRFPLDIAFLDEEGNVVDLRCGVPPWRAVATSREAKHALEVKAGLLAGMTCGDRLDFLPII